MRKKLLEFLALSLAFVLCVPTAGAARRGEEMVRVGLAYGSGALVGANLENNTGYGSGYRFGYFDEDLRFEELGETDEKETQITVLKAQNTWFYYDRSSGKYIYSNSDNGGTVVGCFHLLIDSFRRFDDAAEEAEEYDGGFVAWIDGEYQVRVGAYLSKEDALDAAGISVVRRWVETLVPCPYSLLERLKSETAAWGGVIPETEYGADVTLTVLLPEEKAEAYLAHILDMTAGTVEGIATGERFQDVPWRPAGGAGGPG